MNAYVGLNKSVYLCVYLFLCMCVRMCVCAFPCACTRARVFNEFDFVCLHAHACLSRARVREGFVPAWPEMRGIATWSLLTKYFRIPKNSP